MSDARSRYRRELKSWSKNDLIREVERLRAITREQADRPGDDTLAAQGSMVDVAGDPFAVGGVVMDARNAILMDAVEVCLVDPDPSKVDRDDPEQARLALVLAGRINMRDERSSVLLMLPWDGAAAICAELHGLSMRAGGGHAAALMELLNERMSRMPRPPE